MDVNNFLKPETIELLKSGGYFIMFGLMLLEGPFVTLAAAFLASMGFFNIFIVAILGWLGDTLGDILFFLFGRFGVHIFGKKEKIDTEKKADFLETLEILVQKNFILSLLFIKITPYAPMFAFPYLGSRKIAFTKFATATALLSLPLPITVAAIGYHIDSVRKLIEKIPADINPPYIIAFFIFLLIFAV